MLNYAALITTTVHNGIDPETLQAQKKKKKYGPGDSGSLQTSQSLSFLIDTFFGRFSCVRKRKLTFFLSAWQAASRAKWQQYKNRSDIKCWNPRGNSPCS